MWHWNVSQARSQLLGKLVGILSPVNHKGLHQGWKQTSIRLLFTLHTSHQTTNPPQNHKISPVTNLHTWQNIHKCQTQFFWRISPFDTAPVKKAHKTRTHWYARSWRVFWMGKVQRVPSPCRIWQNLLFQENWNIEYLEFLPHPDGQHWPLHTMT